MQLGSNECRYPVGTAEQSHLFCGRRSKANSPYCPKHHKVCHRGYGVDWTKLLRGIEEAISGEVDRF
jgi:hypothetical protein